MSYTFENGHIWAIPIEYACHNSFITSSKVVLFYDGLSVCFLDCLFCWQDYANTTGSIFLKNVRCLRASGLQVAKGLFLTLRWPYVL